MAKRPGAATFAPPLSEEEKAGRVFDALSEGQRLTIHQLVEVTGMSRAQVRQGWQLLRRYLGQDMCVVEAHRQDTVYYLTDEADDGIRYVLWQSRHVYRRTVSELHSVHQLEDLVARVGPEGLKGGLYAARMGLVQAQGNLGGLIRSLGVQLGHTPAAVEQWLTDPGMKGKGNPEQGNLLERV